MSLKGEGSGITEIVVDELDDILDVVIVSPTSGQLLSYNGVTQKWVNVSAGAVGGVSSLDDLSDVTITTPTSGQFLQYQGGVWVNATAAAGGGTGTVTSAAVTGTDGIGVAGSPITTEGVITLSLGNITPDNISTAGVVSAASLNVTGDIAAATGRVTASAATITGLLTGATASFSGIVSANAGLRATSVSASGVIGGSNLSGTNTGDQTITLTGDVSGSGTGSFATVVTRLQGVQVKAGTPNDGHVLTYNTSAANWEGRAAAGTGTVTSVSAGGGLTASTNPITTTGDISIANTGVSAGSYSLASITVNARGQITAASNGAAGAGTVTSAAVAGTDGIGVAGSPITTEGVITLSLGNITPDSINTAGTVSAASLNVTGDVLAATGRITASAATITGNLTGATANFTGLLSAEAGIRTTTVSAASIGLTGDITADRVTASAATIANRLTAGTALFSGLVSADAGVKTTTVSAASIGVTGDINAAAGRVTASALTVTGLLTGATATFSGIVSANAGLRATSVSASGVIGGSNLSGTNTGDITVAGENYLALTGQAVSAGRITPAHIADAPSKTLLSNMAAASGAVSNNSLQVILDSVLGSATGRVAYRGAEGWVASALGGTGTVTSVSAGAGLLASTNPITSTGDIKLNVSSQNSWEAQQHFAGATLTDASAVSWNLNTQQVASLRRAISGTATISEPTNMRNGATYIMAISKASSNTATVAWASAYRWPGSTEPTFSTASGATDIFTFVCFASVMYGSYTQNYSQP